MNDNQNRQPQEHNQQQPGGNNQPNNSGFDFAAMLNGLLAAGNRRRLVLRHRGETVLRLPLTIVALVVLILLWQSAFLLVALVALILFLQVNVSLERRVDAPPPHEYRD